MSHFARNINIVSYRINFKGAHPYEWVKLLSHYDQTQVLVGMGSRVKSHAGASRGSIPLLTGATNKNPPFILMLGIVANF